jgi:hypothetical protein
MMLRRVFVGMSVILGACAAESDVETSSLALTTINANEVAGSFEIGDSIVAFDSASLDQRRATLHLEINGAAIDAELDVSGRFHQQGYANTLGAEELAALVALRDAVNREHPDLVLGTLQGKFLSRHADWLADAPVGYVVDEQQVDVEDRIIAQTTNDDSVYNTCLTAGLYYTAYYDAGNGGAQWQWTRQANSGSCLGRCGAGCNIFDTDLMLDCFEHDTCVDHFGGSTGSGNANCGDEFSHAVNEYIVTMGAWCP